MVPLQSVNRLLVRAGIAHFAVTERAGLRALMEVARVAPEEIDESVVAFEFAARINAAARIDHIDTAFALLTTSSEKEAQSLARTLDGHNRTRQREVAATAKEAIAEVDKEERVPDVIVLVNETWPIAMLGIVANRLLDRYHRPVFLFSIRGDMARASARSIPGFDLTKAIEACGGKDLFEDFGGHPMAAGCTIRKDWLPLFRERILSYAKKQLTEALLMPTLDIDLEVQAHEVSPELAAWFERLAPFGMGNPRPLVVAKNLEVLEVRAVGRGKKGAKLQLVGNGGGRIVTALARDADRLPSLRAGDRIDVVGELRQDTWRGRKEVALAIVDIKQHAEA